LHTWKVHDARAEIPILQKQLLNFKGNGNRVIPLRERKVCYRVILTYSFPPKEGKYHRIIVKSVKK
jgi:hypothetical protein